MALLPIPPPQRTHRSRWALPHYTGTVVMPGCATRRARKATVKKLESSNSEVRARGYGCEGIRFTGRLHWVPSGLVGWLLKSATGNLSLRLPLYYYSLKCLSFLLFSSMSQILYLYHLLVLLIPSPTLFSLSISPLLSTILRLLLFFSITVPLPLALGLLRPV